MTLHADRAGRHPRPSDCTPRGRPSRWSGIPYTRGSAAAQAGQHHVCHEPRRCPRHLAVIAPRHAPVGEAGGLGRPRGVAVAGSAVAAGRRQADPTPQDTVRAFLVTAVVDQDTVTACKYLTTQAKAEIAAAEPVTRRASKG
jgi:hypothetical protein